MVQLREICELCGNAQPTVFCVENGIEILRCSNCGLIYSSRIQELIFVSEEDPEIIYKETAKFRNRIYRELIGKISLFKIHGSLCDVGCRTGNFLEFALSRYNAFGIEVSDEFAQYCCKKGLKVYSGTLKERKLSDNSVDIITYLSVFEHLKDPCEELEDITRVLKKDGILVLEIPNWTFWHIKTAFLHLLKKHAGLMPLNHFFYYDQRTIKKLLEKFNFEVLFLQFTYSTEGHLSNRLPKVYEVTAAVFSKLPVAQYVCNNFILIAKCRGLK